ncbi:MAG TPA: azurin [Dokdonella sp.]|nr:azurin [Dokdonella sp.]
MIRSLLLFGSVLLAASPAFAACSIDIDGNDAMQFDTKNIEVPKSCTDFTVRLTHSGKLAKGVMGHNWVLTKTADMRGVANDGMSAGLDNDYIKAGDARVIAHSAVIGGGESTTVSFAVSQLAAGADYSFFCSFPGHWSLMKGRLKIV